MSNSTGAELSGRDKGGAITLERALSKVYIPKVYGTHCTVILPMVMAGRRFKIVLED